MDFKKRIVVDIDAGSDDAVALSILLYAEFIGKISIEAICCTMGNTSVDNVCKNVVRILETAKRTDIPVYKGSSLALIPSENPIPLFHGEDGFGDLKFTSEPNTSIIKKTPSAIAMGDLVEQYPGEITLVCLGPLTNVAIAMRLFENFDKNIKELHIMGGNYSAVGNITATAEFNFYVDPEAAHITLETAKCPVYLCTWESCLNTKIAMKWRWNVLGNIKNSMSKLLTDVEKSIYDRKIDISWLPCDGYLVAALIYPDKIIKKVSQHHATVELHGSKTRGQIVLDHKKTKDPNIIVIEEINYHYFKELIIEVFNSFSDN